jgi:hypothetical protein
MQARALERGDWHAPVLCSIRVMPRYVTTSVSCTSSMRWPTLPVSACFGARLTGAGFGGAVAASFGAGTDRCLGRICANYAATGLAAAPSRCAPEASVAMANRHNALTDEGDRFTGASAAAVAGRPRRIRLDRTWFGIELLSVSRQHQDVGRNPDYRGVRLRK